MSWPPPTRFRARLLSNGRYTVMLNESGAGSSRWRELAVTRWREDPTSDGWGSFVLLRDQYNDEQGGQAENEKIAAVDFATATETMADGARRAEIKRAEGVKQAKILEAEGEALAIQLVNEAADRYFTGNAQLLRRLLTVERSLQNNSKVVVPARSSPTIQRCPTRNGHW